MVGIHVRGLRHIALVLVTALLAAIPAVAAHADSTLVSDNPRNWSPNVVNGQVETIAQVDNRIYIGGTFTQIENATSNGGTSYSRTRIAAFDATTGVVDTGFNVTLDGTIVRAILPANDGSGIFIAGDFNTVNGDTERKVAKLNAATGARVGGFDAAHIESEVRDLRQINNQLIVAGFFDEVGFQSRPGLASINGTSGALSSFMDVALAGTHNGGATGAIKMEVTPDDSQLLLIGNFTSADGNARNQIAMLNTSGATASVANWATSFFTSTCSGSFNTYMRDLDIAEDGTYAVISTTGAWAGGINAGVSCDTISRFEIDVTGTGIEPSWVNYTGGDTTYAVEISEGVAYIGGHMRWVNNPYAGDSEGPGAIERDGIAGLDVRNGMPYSWDPGRERGVGVFDFMVNDEGLWGGSDTERWSGELRERLALFPDPPATGSSIVPDDVVETIPGYVFHLGEVSAGGNDDDVRRRFLDPNGTAGNTTTLNGTEDWFEARGAVRVNDTVYTAWSNETLVKRTFDGTSWGDTPEALDLNSSNFIGDLDEVTGMFFDPADGRLYYTLSGNSNLFYRYFTPESDAVGAAPYTADGTVAQLDPDRVRGMFLSGGFIYFADSGSGDLRRVAFADGTVSGSDSLVTSSGDWRTRGLFVGPNVAPTASFSVDCDGRECDFDAGTSSDPDGNIVSYDWDFGDGANGTGESTTHAYDDIDTFTVTLTVTDNDGATDDDTDTATTTNAPPNASFTVDCTFRECSFDAGASSDSDGSIVSYDWDFGDGTDGSGETTSHTYDDVDTYTVTLTVTDNDGGDDDTTRQATTTNQAPTASFTVNCEFRNCDVDASGSFDPDGSIVSYAWNFGDGTGGSGETTSHTYGDAGEYTITLTVTDNDGATDTDSESIEATNEPPPIHVHNLSADPTQLDGDKWKSLVRITVYDANEEPVEGAVVTGIFGTTSERTCTTGANGKCQVKMRVKDAKTEIPFTVTDVAPPAGYADYDATANHDSFGGDSDGTTIVVYQPIDLHSHDLDANPIDLEGPKWRAKVVVTVRDGDEALVEGAEVTGLFGQNKVKTCTTGANGKCTLRVLVNDTKVQIPLAITDITDPNGPGIYDPAGNHDADGDSDGTSITVYNPAL